MNINLEPDNNKKIKFPTNIPKKKLNSHTRRITNNTSRLRIFKFPKRQIFTRKLDSYKKVISTTLTPVTLSLPILQKVIRRIPTTGCFSPGSISFIQNALYGLTDGIILLRNSVNLPYNMRTSHKMEKLHRDFDYKYNYSWNNNRTELSQLNTEKDLIIEQINELKTLKMQKSLLEQSPEIKAEIQYIDNVLKLKNNELTNIKEYLAIRSLESLNSHRIKSKLKTILSSGIGFVSRSLICVLSVLFGSNPITYLPTIILMNNMVGYASISKDIASNFFTLNAKRSRAKNLIDVISSIPNSSINQDIIQKSKLLETPLSAQDIHLLSRLKIKFSNTSFLDMSDDVKDILSNIGKNCLTYSQINTISNFIKNIELNSDKLSYDELTLIENIRAGIDNYNTLLDEFDNDSIQYHINLYNTKMALKEAYHANKDFLYNHKSWIYKALYEQQFFSNEANFQIKVYDYFIEHANISINLKNTLLENSDVSKSSILDLFNKLDSELNQKLQNEHIANYIIDIVTALPTRKGIIKNGKAIPVEKLDLENPDDKILLSEVYENWREYEHAKSFIKASLTGTSTKSANRLMEKIKNIKNIEDREKIYKSILSELSSINA